MENDAHHQPYRVSPVVHNDDMINMTSFYLIRHAQADYFQNEQRPLSEKGQADAERVAGLLGSYAITQIYSSPYQRAVQTVSPLAKKLNLEIVIEPDLRERCLAQGVSMVISSQWSSKPGRTHFLHSRVVKAIWLPRRGGWG
jgi:broad specificity phosphatase PhoE